MGPNNDSVPLNMYTAVNSCPDKDSDVKLLVLIPPRLHSQMGIREQMGACKLKFLPWGRGRCIWEGLVRPQVTRDLLSSEYSQLCIV